MPFTRNLSGSLKRRDMGCDKTGKEKMLQQIPKRIVDFFKEMNVE